MNIEEFIAATKKIIGFPDTAAKRFTLECLPCFKKHEAKYYVNVPDMTHGDWNDAFQEYMSQSV